MKQGIKFVCGVGINDADYITQTYEEYGYVDGKQKRKQLWVCPFYEKWRSMLKRCYSRKYKATHPTYKDVTVCEEWLRFSVFRQWMIAQDWEDNQLDKDLLVSGNKTYSPDTCVFISKMLNTFMVEQRSSKGKYKTGVTLHRKTGKYQATTSDPFRAGHTYLGLFETDEQAHQAWLAKKLEHAKALAALQTDQRIAKALVGRYENYVVN